MGHTRALPINHFERGARPGNSNIGEPQGYYILENADLHEIYLLHNSHGQSNDPPQTLPTQWELCCDLHQQHGMAREGPGRHAADFVKQKCHRNDTPAGNTQVGESLPSARVTKNTLKFLWKFDENIKTKVHGVRRVLVTHQKLDSLDTPP